jgi:hypothetical protein
MFGLNPILRISYLKKQLIHSTTRYRVGLSFVSVNTLEFGNALPQPIEDLGLRRRSRLAPTKLSERCAAERGNRRGRMVNRRIGCDSISSPFRGASDGAAESTRLEYHVHVVELAYGNY